MFRFNRYLNALRIVFPNPNNKATFKEMMDRQSKILYGLEYRKLRHTPKVDYLFVQKN